MPDSALPKKKKRVWLRLLLALFIALFTVVLGALLYAQSSHAFVHVILPAAERALGQTLEADSGSVSIFGNITAENLRYTGADGHDILTAKSVALTLDYFSLAWGPRPVIKSAALVDPKIFIRDGEGEEKKKDKEKEKEKGKEKEPKDGKAKEAQAEEIKALIPVEIRSLRIQNLALAVEQGERKSFELTAANVELDGLAPGGKAQAKLKTNFAVEPGAESERTGAFELDLALDQSGDAMQVSWSGRGNAVLAEPTADNGKKSVITLDISKLGGSRDAKGALKAEIAAKAERDKEPAGSVDASIDYDWSGERKRVDSAIELKEIGRELLNPILAAQGEAQFVSARIDGKLIIKSDGDEIGVDSTLTGRDLSLRARKGEKPTPPLNFAARQELAWNPAKETATIREASAALDRAGEPLGKLKLEKPITLNLKSEEAKEGAAPAEETHLSLELTQLSAENIRPWAEIAGVEAFRGVEEGEISGSLDIAVGGTGERLGWSGDLAVASLVVKREGADKLGPLRIESKLKGAMKDFDVVTLEPTRLALADKAGALAEAKISGEYGVKKGKADLKIEAASDDLSKALNRVGLLGVKGEPSLKGGKLRTAITLARASKEEALIFDGATHIDGIVPIDPKTGEAKGEPSTIDHILKGSFKEPSNLTIDSFKADVVAEGKKLAETLATGTFDFDAGTIKLDAKLDVADVGATMRRLGSPLDGEQATAKGGTLAVRIAMSRASEEAEMLIDATALGEKLVITTNKGKKIEPKLDAKAKIAIASGGREARFDALSTRLSDKPGGAPGLIDAKGYWPIKSGKESRGGKIDVTIRKLNTGPWMDALGWSGGQDLGDAPLEGKMAVSVDPSGDKFTFDGEETLGPIKLPNGDQAPRETTLLINNRLEKLGDDIKSFVIELTSKGGKGEPDNARVTGSAKLGERPSLKADVQIVKLDVSGYTEPPASAEKGGGKDKEEKKPEEAAEPAPSPTPAPAKPAKPEEFPIDLDVKVKIGRLDWRKIEVRDVQASAFSTKSDFKAAIEKMGINGGTLDGTYAMGFAGEERSMEWKAKSSGVELGPILASFHSEGKAKVQGKARITTEGKGRGAGDAFKNSLAGTTVFSVIDGKFGENGLLDALTEATGSNVFQEMVFKGFDGEIELKDGDALLKRVTVDSSAARLIGKGRIGLDRTIDVTVQPGLGPEALRRLPQDTKWLGPISSILGSATDVLDLPLAMAVTGTLDKPRYLPTLRAPDLIKDTVGSIGRGAGSGVEQIMDLNPFKKKEDPEEKAAKDAKKAEKKAKEKEKKKQKKAAEQKAEEARPAEK